MDKETFFEIEEKIGYVFSDKKLLFQAFTHSSYAVKSGEDDNERLEFLGDAVLELIVSNSLYFSESGKMQEGEMTSRRQRLVSTDALKHSVRSLGLDGYLLSDVEIADGKPIASLYEAVVAAIYLDGGYKNAEKFVLGTLKETDEKNSKAELQEYLQARHLPLPTYRVVKKEGQDNAPTFVVEVQSKEKSGLGRGKTKRDAEQEAASYLLETLKNEK